MTLQELLKLERPLLVFDCETTGPNPREDRIIEIGFIQIRPDGTSKAWESFINPGIPIPKEATFGNPEKGYDGHGITDEKVQGCRMCGAPRGNEQHSAVAVVAGDDSAHDFLPWPAFTDLAESLLRGFNGTDFAGFNVKRYDLPIMQSEFERHGHVWDYSTAKIIDGFRLWQLGEHRTLSDAVQRFLGRKHEGAHRALDDVKASLDVIIAQLETFTVLPRDLNLLHGVQYPVDPNAIDPDGKVIWKDGFAVLNFGKKYMGKRLDMMQRRDLDWIVNTATGISPAVKNICRDAMNGKFPTRTS